MIPEDTSEIVPGITQFYGDKLLDVNGNIAMKPTGEMTSNRLKSKCKKIVESSNGLIYIVSGDFDIVWTNVMAFALGHIVSVFFIAYLVLYSDIRRLYGAAIVTWFTAVVSGIGTTAGAHRLWAHRSYKARRPLRIALMLAQTIAGQNCLYIWCRDHRVHHKYSETDADPHNTKRGFFFAHVGWLMRKKHPRVIIESAKLQFDDLLKDPVVKFQMTYYNELYLVFAFLVPILLPYYLFNITLAEAFALYAYRYLNVLHLVWFVNSSAHMFGDQPYDTKQAGRENLSVALTALGEGYHNYHHTFPYDYRAAELGSTLNPTKIFIDLMAYFGQAYDLKFVSDETVERSKLKAGERLPHDN